MAPQRRSSDATQPPDGPGAPPAGSRLAPTHPAFAVPGRDAFRDKAERDARKRAEQAARRKAPAWAATAFAAPIDSPQPAQANIEPPAPAASPMFAPPLFMQAGQTLEPKRPSAAIIPWPVHERLKYPVRASSDTPTVERPPATESPVVGKPKANAKPKSPVAPFGAAAFWGEKKTPGGGSGGGDGSGGGKDGGPSSGEQKTGGFNQDDVAGIVVVLLILALIGWMAFNWLGKSSKEARVVQPQSALNTPAPSPSPAPPVVKSDPFPAGPVDLKPKSPMPPTALAEIAPSPAPVVSAPLAIAQAAPSPPTPAASPIPSTCTPGRMIHAYFCTSRSDLTPAARSALDADLDQWRSCIAGQELVVKGYADTRGSQELNAALGERRAKQLADILRAQGLNVTAVVGVGKLDELEQGQNCLNQRRVDIGLKSEIDAATPSKACAPPKSVAPITCGTAAPRVETAAVNPAR
jgi:outer membrane protein OmpA-like peptidoglycan-associated protein